MVSALRSRRHFERSSSGRDPWPRVILAVVIAISAIILVELAVVLWIGVLKDTPGVSAIQYSASHYTSVFSDPFTYKVLLNTLGFSFVTLAVALAFGAPAAWLAERTDLPGKTVAFTLMTIGLLLPGFTSAMGWVFMLHPKVGLANDWLVGALHLQGPPFAITGVVGMGWVEGLNLAPIAFVMTAVVFRAMNPALEEAAQMAGANFRQTWFRVTIRLALPGVLAASIYIFTIGFAAFDVPAIIGLGNRVFTFSTYLLTLLQSEVDLPRYGAVAALSTVVLALAGALSWWYNAVQRRAWRYSVVTGKGYRPRILKLGRWVWPAWIFLGLYFVLSKLLPILVLIWASLLPYLHLPSLDALAAVSLVNFHKQNWELVISGLINTGVLMILTPTLAVVVSLAFSWIVLRTKIRGRSLFDFVAFLPHAVPNIVFGVATLLVSLFIVDKIVPIYGTVWLLLLAFVVGRISYGTRMTNTGLIQIDKELDESAQVCGASTLSVLTRVLVPLLAPTMLYAWLWIALLAYRELTLAVLLTTTDNMTLPVLIWNTWFGGAQGPAAALSLIMLGGMAPLIVVYWLVVRRSGVAPVS
jgi:iron(III) transport system permease protein